MNLLPGWQQHPTNPAYAFNAQQQVVPIAQAMAPGAAAVPAVPEAPAVAAPVVPAAMTPVAQDQAAQMASEYSYGATTREALDQQGQQLANVYGSYDHVWFKWPDYDMQNRSVVQCRILPPWEVGRPKPAVISANHRVPMRYIEVKPNAIPKKDEVIDCPKLSDGPHKTCALCVVQAELFGQGEAGKEISKYINAKVSTLWQALNMTQLEKNFKTDNTGATIVVPTILRTTKALSEEITAEVTAHSNPEIGGDFTDPVRGYPISIRKKKTGPLDMNVEYKLTCHPDQRGPLPVELFPVLGKLADLEGLLRFRPDSEMETIANAIRQAHGLGGAPAALPAAYAAPTAPQMPAAPPGVVPQPMAAPVAPPLQAAPPAPVYAPPVVPQAPPPVAAAMPAAPPVVPVAPVAYAPPAAPPMPVAPPAPPIAAAPTQGLPPPGPPGGIPAAPAVPPPPAAAGMPSAVPPAAPVASTNDLEGDVANGGTPF